MSFFDLVGIHKKHLQGFGNLAGKIKTLLEFYTLSGFIIWNKFLMTQCRKEIISFVIGNDKSGEIFHRYFTNGFHA